MSKIIVKNWKRLQFIKKIKLFKRKGSDENFVGKIYYRKRY